MNFDEHYAVLVKEVRKHRAQMSVCPSAQDHVDVPSILLEFCENSFYKEDYQAITDYFAADFVPYEETIKTIRGLAQSNLFVE